MALNLSRSFTYTSGNTIASSENNTNENTLYNAFSGLEAGTKSFSILPLDADPTSALYAATKQYVDNYADYKRPELQYISATLVDVNDNTGTANQTKIRFHDGSYRSVTEDTSSTNKYRRFDITATANFTSGTEDSGMLSGESEPTNGWVAIYAVKSQINTANFVLVGSQTLPVQGSYSTLNTNFGGTGSWVYLGLIVNGNNAGTTGDIVAFVQSGNKTILYGATDGGTPGGPMEGIELADTAGATSLTYTYAAGVAAAQIPANISIVDWVYTNSNDAAAFAVTDSGSAVRYKNWVATAGAHTDIIQNARASYGIKIASAGSVSRNICMRAFVDDVLGVGSNPLIS